MDQQINFDKLEIKEGNIKKVKKQSIKHSKDNALEENEKLELFRTIKQSDYGAETKYKYEVLIHLLMDTGLRVSEALQVRLEWFKETQDGLVINIPSSARDMSNLKRDWKPKTLAGARELLFIDKGVGEKVRPFFINNKSLGFSRQRAYQIIKKLGGIMGKPKLHPHALRSTCANTLVYQGTNMITLCYYMGWSDLNTARNYIKTSPIAARRDLLNKFREDKNGRF